MQNTERFCGTIDCEHAFSVGTVFLIFVEREGDGSRVDYVVTPGRNGSRSILVEFP